MLIDRRRFVGLCSLAPLSQMISACSHETEDAPSLDTLRTKARQGEFKIGFIPYYEIATDNGQNAAPTGFLTDVFKLFLQQSSITDAKLIWRQLSWDSFAPLVQAHAIDLSIAGTFITPARSEKVAFTKPVFSLGNGAAVKIGSRFADGVKDVMAFDEKGIRVAVVSGEQSAEYVQRHFTQATTLMLDGPDLAAAPRAVQAGRADVALSDQFILGRYITKHPDLVDVLRSNPFSVLPIAWAIPKGEDRLLSEINTILNKILLDKDFFALKNRYNMIPFA